MRAFVFTDESLKRYAGQFVWLSINTEKADSAAFLTKFPVQAWPSFFVVDSKNESVAIRWVGGATVPQLQKLLTNATKSMHRSAVGEALARADHLYGEGKNAEAAEAYHETLRLAPQGWPEYARAVESLIFALQRVPDSQGCAKTAQEAYARLAQTPSAANVASSGLDCAVSMKADDPEREELIAKLRQACRELVASNRTDIAADDLSTVYISLVDEREAAHD